MERNTILLIALFLFLLITIIVLGLWNIHEAQKKCKCIHTGNGDMQYWHDQFEKEKSKPVNGSVLFSSSDKSDFQKKINGLSINDRYWIWANPELKCKVVIKMNDTMDSDSSNQNENQIRMPEIGDMVYCWDEDKPKCYYFGELNHIYLNHEMAFLVENTRWKYCSLNNPLTK